MQTWREVSIKDEIASGATPFSTASTQDVKSLTNTLEQEILDCMIKECNAELSGHIKMIESLEGTLYDAGWEAFLSSIRLLIDGENSVLQTNS